MENKKYIVGFCLVIVPLFFHGSIFSQTGPAAMLPGESDIPGWRRDKEFTITSLEKYKSTDPEKAMIYSELGLDYSIGALYYSLKGGRIKVRVDVTESSFGAFAIFSRNAYGLKWISEYGNKSYSEGNRYGFWKHLYCISMESDTVNSVTEEGFRQIAAWIDSKIRMKGSIPGVSDLMQGRSGNVTLFRGKLGLSEIYYFSPLNVFNISEGIAIEEEDKTEIFLKYEDSNEAVRRFTEAAGILGSMKKFSDFIMLSDFAWAMKDVEGRTLTFKAEQEYIKILIKRN